MQNGELKALKPHQVESCAWLVYLSGLYFCVPSFGLDVDMNKAKDGVHF